MEKHITAEALERFSDEFQALLEQHGFQEGFCVLGRNDDMCLTGHKPDSAHLLGLVSWVEYAMMLIGTKTPLTTEN